MLKISLYRNWIVIKTSKFNSDVIKEIETCIDRNHGIITRTPQRD